MNKQTIDKEQDIEQDVNPATEQEAASADAACDTMADGEVTDADKVSVEPSLEEQIAAWRDKYLRLQAEFDNFRKRTVREKMELVERGCEGAWKAILPIMDDMERAVAASRKSDDVEALRQGEELVMKKFESILQNAGITPIECVDKPFNEEDQEAVARFAARSE